MYQPWKIWIEYFDAGGRKVGAGVYTTEYKFKGNAERAAKKRFGDNKHVRYTISKTNPWERKVKEKELKNE